MKHQKTKFLTLSLASLLGALAIGGGTVLASADDTSTTPTPVTYSATDVFSATTATINTAGSYVSFGVKDTEGSVALKQRDLAWKWFTEKGTASYLNFKLSLADLNFEEITVSLETAAATANKDNKAVNTLTFTHEGGVVSVAVNGGNKTALDVAPATDAEKIFAVSINENGTAYGEYNVVINDGADKPVGTFTNVGAAYGEYAAATATTPLTPFTVSVKLPEKSDDDKSIKESVVRLVELNGQSFAIKNGKIEDNAKPVLVVNDEISSITLGTSFSLDYDVVDVLDKTVDKTMKYVQYNPTVADADVEYKDLTTTTYFYDTVYEKDGGVKTTVYDENNGKEFVSIRFTLADEFYKGDTKAEYELAWYASHTETVGTSTKDYIVLDRNAEGASYTFLNAVADEDANHNKLETGKNVLNDPDKIIEAYQKLVTTAAEGLKAGSTTNFYLPSMVGYIADNGGYTNLKFTISYRSTNASSASTRSSLTSSNLQFPVSKSGDYQFKVFALDKAGNSMMYYNEDSELVKVSTSNVWDIEEIPYFEFSVPEASLEIKDNATKDTDRKDSVAVGETFDDFDLTVLGDSASSAKLESKLYRIDVAAFNKAFPTKTLTASNITSITYGAIADEASNGYKTATDYAALYFDALVSLVAKKVNVDKAALLAANVFVEVEAYNERITEENAPEEYKKNNVYKWNPEKQSFVAANENDIYLVLGVYTDAQIPSLKACGYKVVTVEAEDDVLPGEDNWLKNNVTSVVLFSIAGVMLILIVIVLLVKPSNESLEEVEAKAKAKKEKKEKKAKKQK